jgi:hypothetical protein
VDGCQCGYTTNVEKKSLGTDQVFFLFGVRNSAKMRDIKLKREYSVTIFSFWWKICEISKLKKKPIRHIWTFDFSLVAFLKLGF